MSYRRVMKYVGAVAAVTISAVTVTILAVTASRQTASAGVGSTSQISETTPDQKPIVPGVDDLLNEDILGRKDLGSWCHRFGTKTNTDVCVSLDNVSKSGRTDGAAKAAYQAYQKEAEMSKLSGYMIAKLDDGAYEVNTGGRTHSILLTHDTTFTSSGYFSLWAMTKLTKKLVTTVDGFDQKWTVYEEDSYLGPIIDEISRADSGEPTKRAARDGLEKFLHLNDADLK